MLLCVITQRVVVIYYQRFATTYRSHPQASRSLLLFVPKAPERNFHYSLCNHPEEHSCQSQQLLLFLISNFRRVLYVVCFLLGNSPESEFSNRLRLFPSQLSPVWIPQLFSNLVILHLLAYEDGTDRVFRNVGI